MRCECEKQWNISEWQEGYDGLDEQYFGNSRLSRTYKELF